LIRVQLQVKLEGILGQKFFYMQSLTLSTLLEHLGVVQASVKHVAIDCLSNVVHSLMLGSNSEATITEGMSTIGEAVKILISRNPGLRVYIAQPVPRRSTESREACIIAMVMVKNLNFLRFA